MVGRRPMRRAVARSSSSRPHHWLPQLGLQKRAVVLETWSVEAGVFPDVVVASQAYRVLGIWRRLERGHVLGGERPALQLQAEQRRLGQLVEIRRLDGAEIPLRGDVHADRFGDLVAEVLDEE